VLQKIKRSLLAALAIFVLALAALGSPTAAQAADCPETVVNIVAHQDDDLFFMSPDLVDDVKSGACVVTVFMTAGDAGRAPAYWRARETGSHAAYNTMLGLSAAAAWSTSTVTFAGKAVPVATSPGDGRITGVYLRLPDGGIGGDGWASSGEASLLKLWNQSISSLVAVDGSAQYTRESLIATLGSIISWSDPREVHVQDFETAGYDHSDHRMAGRFAAAALQGYAGMVLAYRGYNAQTEAANVSGDDLSAKTAALLSYAEYDPLLCSSAEVCPGGSEAQWTQRQYSAPLLVDGNSVAGPAAYGGPNVARNALVAVSSAAAGQSGTAAIDAVVAGWPANGGAEWSSNGERAGAWLSLSWSSVQTLDRVYLYDRPNGTDQVTGGVLKFSDGSTVTVPSLNNDGSATVVTFAARSVSSVLFTVSSVSSGTQNVGLAEIEAYHGDPAAVVEDPVVVDPVAVGDQTAASTNTSVIQTEDVAPSTSTGEPTTTQSDTDASSAHATPGGSVTDEAVSIPAEESETTPSPGGSDATAEDG